MSHLWPQVSDQRPAYLGLSTDYWPWPEVYSDLSQRPAFSGVLEIEDGKRRARAWMVDGELVGTSSEEAEADLAAVARELPRARVSLYQLDAAVARIAWQCRNAQPEESAGDWSTQRPLLTRRAFSGIVRSGQGDSFWQGGVRFSGAEPAPKDRVVLYATPVAALSAEVVLEFFNAAIRQCASLVDFEAHWRPCALNLADEHPSLDPFAREVVLERGQLRLLAPVPAEELLPALQAAFTRTVRRAGQRMAQLPLDPVRSHPLWAASRLGEA